MMHPCQIGLYSPFIIGTSRIPHGPSLEPLLFLIYINNSVRCALEKCQPDIYTDDTGIFTSGNFLKIFEVKCKSRSFARLFLAQTEY